MPARRAAEPQRWRDLSGADAALATGAKLAPSNPEIAQMKAELALARGDDAAAVKALGAQASTLEGRFLVARALVARGKFVEAEAKLRGLAKDFPKIPEIARQLAACLKAQGKVDLAAEVLEALLARDPDNPHAQAELALLREIQGRHGEAADLYVKVLPRGSTPDLYVRAVRSLLEADRNAQAAALADEGSLAYPADRQLPNLAGDIYRDRLADPVRARIAFGRYVARGGEDPAVLAFLAAAK